jgi:hypothetical protein
VTGDIALSGRYYGIVVVSLRWSVGEWGGLEVIREMGLEREVEAPRERVGSVDTMVLGVIV